MSNNNLTAMDWQAMKKMSDGTGIGKEAFSLAAQIRDELFPYSSKLKIYSKIPFIGGLFVKDILQDSKVYQEHEITHQGKCSDIRKMAVDMFLAASTITMPGTSTRATKRLVKQLCPAPVV